MLSEKVTRPHVRANRPILIPSVPVSTELKFDMVVSFSVAWFERWPSCLVEWVGSCRVVLVRTCLGYNIWVESMLSWSYLEAVRVLSSPVPEGCLCLGYLKGSAAELLHGTLKLRNCISINTMRFSLGRYPGSEVEVVKNGMLHLHVFLMKEVTLLRASS